MSISIVANNIAVLKGTTERVSITVTDSSSGAPVNIDPYDIKLSVTDIGGNIVLYDTWPTPNKRIIRAAEGEFYVDFGPPTAELSVNHTAGVTTLTVLDALPVATIGWPSTGEVIIDYGDAEFQEKISYSADSLVAGVGTITLEDPTEFAHVQGAYIVGPARETNNLRDYLFNWRIQIDASGQVTNSIQKVTVASHHAISMISDLKLLIDKSRKLTQPESGCFLGYSDAQLLQYLYGGLQTINAYQPSLTFSFESFPFDYKQILVDAAMIVGVMSQQLYAIDTDMNYSDQGTSFQITHQAQLAGFLNALTQRLDKLIPQMKLQLLNPGTLHTQIGPNYRLSQIIQSSPSGSLFRGIWFNS